MTLSVSYYKDWNIVNQILFSSPFSNEPHTAANIERALSAHRAAFGILVEDQKYLSYMSDQGTDIVAALRERIRLKCLSCS